MVHGGSQTGLDWIGTPDGRDGWAQFFRVHVDFVHLADLGIHGNGHMMMMEKNSDEIAAVAARWLEEKVGPEEKRAQAR